MSGKHQVTPILCEFFALYSFVAGLLDTSVRNAESPTTSRPEKTFSFFPPSCLEANAEMVPKFKLLLHASHAAINI
jgi:hypothetical protein